MHKYFRFFIHLRYTIKKMLLAILSDVLFTDSILLTCEETVRNDGNLSSNLPNLVG